MMVAASRRTCRQCESATRKPYVDMPKTHCGTPNSASIGHTGSSAPSRRRYRFHHPVRSETKYSSPSGDQTGWKMDSSVAAGDARGCVNVAVVASASRPTARSRPRACSGDSRRARPVAGRRGSGAAWSRSRCPIPGRARSSHPCRWRRSC